MVGGKFSVESRPRKGTTIRADIPMNDAGQSSKEAKRQTPVQTDSHTMKKRSVAQAARRRRNSRGARKSPGLNSAPEAPSEDLFPIIGIGASAGGLEALELFLGHVPKNSGIGFVIVQHLDPTHKGIMVELLQRSTTMPVIRSRIGRESSPITFM